MKSVKCPHCQTTINVSTALLGSTPSAEGLWEARQSECPECKKSIIILKCTKSSGSVGFPTVRSWIVYPRASSRPPAANEVNEDIRSLYDEASLIANDSPRAAGALLRRALQQIIHDTAGIKRRDLNAEITELISSNQLPSYITDILDSVRVVGNFAAHPIKSSSTGCIIDVEIGEVELCFDVIEALFDFYFVQPSRIAAQKAVINKKLQDAGKPLLK
jgi:hypothetical protein